MQPIDVGDIQIFRVTESDGPTPAGFLLPGATEEILRANADRMAPHFYDPSTGMLNMSIHSLSCVRTITQFLWIPVWETTKNAVCATGVCATAPIWMT